MSSPPPFEAHWRRQMADYRPEATDADWSALEGNLPPAAAGRSARAYAILLVGAVVLGGVWLFTKSTSQSLSTFPITLATPALPVIDPVGSATESPDPPPLLLPKQLVEKVEPLTVPPLTRPEPPVYLADNPREIRIRSRITTAVRQLPTLPVPAVRFTDSDPSSLTGKSLIVMPPEPKAAAPPPGYNGLYPRLRRPKKKN